MPAFILGTVMHVTFAERVNACAQSKDTTLPFTCPYLDILRALFSLITLWLVKNVCTG